MLPSRNSSLPDPQISTKGEYAPPSKRRKYESDTHPSIATSPYYSQYVHSKVDEGEAQRQPAIERLAEGAEESMWMLSTLSDSAHPDTNGMQQARLRVRSAGYSDIDSEPHNSPIIGRRSFGKLNREVEVRLAE